VVIPKYTAKLTEPRGLASAEKGDSPGAGQSPPVPVPLPGLNSASPVPFRES
jgi:hypothetical protein